MKKLSFVFVALLLSACNGGSTPTHPLPESGSASWFSSFRISPETSVPWHWVSPYPQGETITAVAYGDNLFVALAADGTVLTSEHGKSWSVEHQQSLQTEQYIHTPTFWYGITYGKGTFVAVGSYGAIATSPNGTDWTLRRVSDSSSPPPSLNSVAFGANTFVAVGGGGVVLTSPDGITWTTQSSGTFFTLDSIIYANNEFVAAGTAGCADAQDIFISPNGTSWIPHTFPGACLTSLTYGNGLFVAASGSSIYTSSGAVNWTFTDSPPYGNGSTAIITSVAFGNGIFVAVAGGLTYYSSDATNWTYGGNGNSSDGSLAFGDGRFVATGGEEIQSSTNGSYWFTESSNITNGNAANGNALNCVTYANGVWIAAGNDLYWSENGTHWIATGSGVNIRGVAYGNGEFVAVSPKYVFMSSTGGAWSAYPQSNMYAVTYASGQWIGVGKGGNIYSSPNANAWTPHTYAGQNPEQTLTSVTYGNGMYVAVGGNVLCCGIVVTGIVTSPDGINWTAQNVPPLEGRPVHSVTFGNGQFVAVGDNGTVLTSTNGTAWTSQSSGVYGNFASVAFSNGTFTAVSNDDERTIIATSTNGVYWIPESFYNTNAVGGIAFSTGATAYGIIVGQNGTILSNQ